MAAQPWRGTLEFYIDPEARERDQTLPPRPSDWTLADLLRAVELGVVVRADDGVLYDAEHT